MDDALVVVDEELVEDQRVGLFAQAPEHHQDDDLQVFERHGSARNGHGPVDDHFAHGGGQHARGFEEADETDAAVAQVILLHGRVHPKAVGCLGLGMGFRNVRQAVEPVQSVLDLVVLESGGRQLAGELVVIGAGVRAPVVLVEVHEYIEHETTITQGRRT